LILLTLVYLVYLTVLCSLPQFPSKINCDTMDKKFTPLLSMTNTNVKQLVYFKQTVDILSLPQHKYQKQSEKVWLEH